MLPTTVIGLTAIQILLELDWSRSEAQARVRVDQGQISTLVSLVGMQLDYRVGDIPTRRCLGHRSFKASGALYVDCLKTPKSGSKKCVSCSIQDAAFANNVHHAHTKPREHIDQSFVGHLAKPNRLYLAAFRDGSIKVGTSTTHRAKQRLAEQGAWQARFIADSSDGYVVREAEDLITEFVGLRQSVGVKAKLAGLVDQTSDHQLHQTLDNYANAARALLDQLQDERLTTARDQWSNPQVNNSIWESPVRYPLRLDAGSHKLKVMGACGRVVALERTNPKGAVEPYVFLADLGQLFGLELEMGDFNPNQIAVQPSLF